MTLPFFQPFTSFVIPGRMCLFVDFYSELISWQSASSWVSSNSLISESFHQAVCYFMRWFSRGTLFLCPSLSTSSHLFPVACFHIITSRATAALNFILASEGCLLFFISATFQLKSKGPCLIWKRPHCSFCSPSRTARSDRRLVSTWGLGSFGHFKRRLGKTSISWWCFDSDVKRITKRRWFSVDSIDWC